MKRMLLILGLLVFFSEKGRAQDRISDLTAKIKTDSNGLVSSYTFRRMVQNDFSKITTGGNGNSKVGRYATLDINKEESKFYFSPIVFVPNKKPTDLVLSNVHTVDISGSINSSNVFDVKKKNTLTLGYSFTKAFKVSYFFNGKMLANDLLKNQKQRIKDEVIVKLAKMKNSADEQILDSLDNSSLMDAKVFEKKSLEMIADYEEKLTEDMWTAKRIYWTKLNLNVVSFDNFYIVDNSNPTSYNSPIFKSLFTPSINLSLNSLWSYHKWGQQLYGSVWGKIGMKHSLSEFSETTEWVKYQKLSDTTFITDEKNDVYVIKEADLVSKLKFDFGMQLTYLFTIKQKVKTGFDFTASYKSIVAPTNANALKLSFGIIFPFTDKDGETSINIEPFYAFTKFSNIDMEDRNFWGLRFGLPFNKP